MLHCSGNTNFFCEIHLESDTVAQLSWVEFINPV